MLDARAELFDAFRVSKSIRVKPGLADCNCLAGTICTTGDYQRGICPRAIFKRKQQEINMSKEESVKAAMGQFEEAIGAVYDAGLEAGKAEAPAPVEQAPVEIPAPVAVDPNDEEKLAEALKPFQDRIAELEAKLAEPDLTDKTQADIDAAVEKAVADLKAEYDAAADEKDLAEEKISEAMKALAEQVSALTTKKAAPAVEDGAPAAEGEVAQ